MTDAYTLKCVTTLTSLEKLEDIWQSLYESNDTLTHFQTYEWNAGMIKGHAYGGKYFVYLLYKNDELILIAPMQKCKNGLFSDLTFLGHDTHADYLDFIYKNIEASDLKYLVRALTSAHKMSLLRMSFINGNSRTVSLLKQVRMEMRHEIKKCVHIKIADSEDAYINTIGKSTKREIRSGIAKLSRNFNVEYKMYGAGERLDETLVDRLLEIYVARNEEKSVRFRFDGEYMGFLRDYICNSGNAFAAVLYLDNDIAAFNLGFKQDRTMIVLLVAMDSTYKSYNAGNLLLYHTIGSLIKLKRSGASDVGTYDLTRGEELYKLKYGGAIHYNHSFEYAYFRCARRIGMKLARVYHRFAAPHFPRSSSNQKVAPAQRSLSVI
ncbi:MAG: GNAT family N-acetyltransferase [Verrucomicrobiota bacterium]